MQDRRDAPQDVDQTPVIPEDEIVVPEDNRPLNKDSFEISFRILGNEFFGMEISSESKAKNWAFFGLMTLVALTVLINNLGPSLISIVNNISG